MENNEGSAKIDGIGHYVPEKVLNNFDFEKMVDTSNEWIITRTGIKERHIASEDEASSDLAYHASIKAMEDAGVVAGELDMIIVGTVTPDIPFPSTGCLLQDRLGAENAAAFDVSAACSGFLYGVTLAKSMIVTGQMKTILVVGVETLSSIMNYEDRSTCVIFGDGAGAVVMKPCPPGQGVLSTYILSDGSLAELLYIPSGGSRRPLNEERLKAREQYVRMRGNELFKYAVRYMVQSARKVIGEAGITIEELDYLIPHQANIRIIEGVRKRLKLPKEKVVVNIDRIGNTSSASIPIALGELKESGGLKRGSNVLFSVFGGGLTWGSAVVRF
jgi:3-oxoacyl-[acyl-carrier-protein] synthase-3